MNKILFVLLSIGVLALVSANVLEIVTVNQDVFDGTGAFIGPRTSLTGASVEGYVCGDATCSFTTGTFLASTFIPGSSYILDYPSTLASPFGYALFYTKPGYIPFEVRSTYAGTGSTTGEAILTKKQTCTFPLTIATITNTTQTTIVGTLSSPLSHTGPLPTFPSSLLSHYQITGTLSLTLTNSTFSNTTVQPKTLTFSEVQPFTISTGAPNGTYVYTLTTSSTDAKCLAFSNTTSTGTIALGTLPSTNTTSTNSTNTTSTNSTNITAPTLTIFSPQALIYANATILINISATNASTITASIPGFLSTTYTAPFTLILPNGTYTLTATATNATLTTSTNVTFSVNTSAGTTINTTDTTPPASVSNVQILNQTSSSLTFNWTNPSNSDFSHVQVFINAVPFINLTGTNYTLTGLLPNTTYTITLFTWDTANNRNNTGITFNATTLSLPGGALDPTLPGPVLNLTLTAQTNSTLTWTWVNPVHQNFSRVFIYLNAILQGNTTSTTYTATNLQPGTTYTLTLRTVNATGATTGSGASNTTATLALPSSPPSGINGTTDSGGKKKRTSSSPLTTKASTGVATMPVDQKNILILESKRTEVTSFPLEKILILFVIGSSSLLLAVLLYLLASKQRRKVPPAYKMPGF